MTNRSRKRMCSLSLRCDFILFFVMCGPRTELGSLLGEGAFARVVMGLDRTTLQQYAVKVIEKQSDDAQGLEFIWRELNVMKAVNHPNIVRTYDIFDTRSRLYIVLEYMPGGTLADLLKHTGRFTEAQARPVLRDILRGVAYLHSKSVVHRDLKLKNILCDRRELPVSVKLAGACCVVVGWGWVGMFEVWRSCWSETEAAACVFWLPAALRVLFAEVP